MKHLLYTMLCILCLFLISCVSHTHDNSSASLDGYQLESIAGSDFLRASRYANDTTLLEEGQVLNGLRQGTWLTYYPSGRIQLLSSYRDDQLNGVVLRFDERGQITEKTYYKNDLYHGPRVTYRFGRPQQEMNYVENLLDGIKNVYQANGKLQQEIEYRMGKQDGIYRYYDDNGNVTLDYVYKDGEKVSGGIVEPPAPVDE